MAPEPKSRKSSPTTPPTHAPKEAMLNLASCHTYYSPQVQLAGYSKESPERSEWIFAKAQTPPQGRVEPELLRKGSGDFS